MPPIDGEDELDFELVDDDTDLGEGIEDAAEDDEEADEQEPDDGSQEEDGGDETEDEEDEESSDSGRPVLEDDKSSKKDSRSNKRIRALAARNKEATAKLLEAERKLADIASTQSAFNNQQAREREAAIAQLSPEARREYELNEAIRRNEYELKLIRFQSSDNADKQGYEAKALIKPIYAKLASRVEAELAKLQKEQGFWAPREKILASIIGEMVLANKLKPTTKKAAAASLKQQKTKPTSGRSDAAPATRGSNGTGRDARERRLSSAKF